MIIPRPAPKLFINIMAKHDIHIGTPFWVEALPPVDEQDRDKVYLIFLPCEDRDRSMGAFIEFWDAVEGRMHNLFQTLAKTPYEITNTLISSYNGTKPLADAIGSMAEGVLPDVELKIFKNLLDRVRKMATKRNRIIHGHWLMTLNYDSVDGPNGSLLRPTGGKWERIYQPISPGERMGLIQGEQKVDAKYKFSLERLGQEVENIYNLLEDFDKFTFVLDKIILPEEQP